MYCGALSVYVQTRSPKWWQHGLEIYGMINDRAQGVYNYIQLEHTTDNYYYTSRKSISHTYFTVMYKHTYIHKCIWTTQWQLGYMYYNVLVVK